MRKEIWLLHPRICHYTRFETLFKIIESKTLWATHFSHLNDSSELYYSEELISEAVYEKLKENYGDVLTLEQVKDMLRRSLYAALEEGVYVVSFCKLNTKLKENDGILSMWRSYGNDGCYIEFDSKIIYEYIDNSVSKIFDEVFYHCVDGRYQECKDLATEIAHKAVQINEGKRDRGLLLPFCKLAPMLKHPGFYEEKEIRLTILNSVSGSTDISFPVMQNRFGKEYIALSFDPNGIKRIVVGPNKAQKYRMYEIRQRLHSFDEFKHVEVASSTIPYRDWS